MWVKPCNQNKIKILESLKEIGIEKKILNALSKLDFTTHLFFTGGEEPFKTDFMTFITGVSFEVAFAQKIISEIDELQIPFINIKHLIFSKINTGRTKDILDVEELQKLEQTKNNKK